MKKICIFCLFSFLFFNIQAQTVNETVKSADSLLMFGQEEKATKMYRRAAYFADKSHRPLIWFRAAVLADSLSLSRYVLYACNALTEDDFGATNEILVKCNLMKTKHLIAQGSYIKADSVLKSESLVADTIFQHDENVLRMILLVHNDNFVVLKAHLYTMAIDSSEIEKVLHIYQTQFIPNSETAAVLSTILPGIGQVYAGYPEDAAYSFLLNAGLFALLYELSVEYRGYTAILSVYPWFARYFSAGVEQARSRAGQKQELYKQNMIRDLLKLIEKQ